MATVPMWLLPEGSLYLDQEEWVELGRFLGDDDDGWLGRLRSLPTAPNPVPPPPDPGKAVA